MMDHTVTPAPAPRRRPLHTSADFAWTHAVVVPVGHPLTAHFPAGTRLHLRAPCDRTKPLPPGRYIDCHGRVRECVAGVGGVTFLAGIGAPAGDDDDAWPIARIVSRVIYEDEPVAISNVVQLARTARSSM